MSKEKTEKPALVEEIGLLEGLTITKGPRLFPEPETLQEAPEDE